MGIILEQQDYAGVIVQVSIVTGVFTYEGLDAPARFLCRQRSCLQMDPLHQLVQPGYIRPLRESAPGYLANERKNQWNNQLAEA